MPRPPSNFVFVGVLAPVNLIWIWGGGTQPQLYGGGGGGHPTRVIGGHSTPEPWLSWPPHLVCSPWVSVVSQKMGGALVPEHLARGFESPLDLLTERAGVNRQVLGSIPSESAASDSQSGGCGLESRLELRDQVPPEIKSQHQWNSNPRGQVHSFSRRARSILGLHNKTIRQTVRSPLEDLVPEHFGRGFESPLDLLAERLTARSSVQSRVKPQHLTSNLGVAGSSPAWGCGFESHLKLEIQHLWDSNPCRQVSARSRRAPYHSDFTTRL